MTKPNGESFSEIFNKPDLERQTDILEHLHNNDILSRRDKMRVAGNPSRFLSVLKDKLSNRLDMLEDKRDKMVHASDSDITTRQGKEEIDQEIVATEEDISVIQEHEDEILNHLGDIQSGRPSSQEGLEKKLNEAEHRLSEIRGQQNAIDNLEEELETKTKKIEDLQQTAEGLLERTTSGALGEQFDDRKKELEKTLQYWKAASVASILALLLAAGVLYADIRTGGSDALLSISKLALILPISVAVWFTVSNYSRQKKLMEEYEFKARMALSLNGFREVLREEVGEENQEEVAQFVTATMEKIYSNPQQNIENTGDKGQQGAESPPAQGPLVELLRKYQ